MFVWNVDPNLFFLPDWLMDGRGIRYYGVLYALALMGGFYFWRWQMLRGGHEEKVAEQFLTIGVLAVILGARLGHVFFYDWDKYKDHLWEIPKFWKGGLASHGTTVALIGVLIWFARRHGLRVREVLDRIAMAVAWAASLVRIGNFMNSEIVGRVTDGAIKVKFPLHDYDKLVPCDSCGTVAKDVCDFIARGKGPGQCVSFANVPWRHPSQIYEALMGAGILVLLLLVDRRLGEKRPLGLLGFLFIFTYFLGRFLVEYVKEFQTASTGLTRGQQLSIPLILVGLIGLVFTLARPERTPPGKLSKPAEA